MVEIANFTSRIGKLFHITLKGL